MSFCHYQAQSRLLFLMSHAHPHYVKLSKTLLCNIWLKLWLWHWAEVTHSQILYIVSICNKLFKNPCKTWNVIEQTQNTAMFYLLLFWLESKWPTWMLAGHLVSPCKLSWVFTKFLLLIQLYMQKIPMFYIPVACNAAKLLNLLLNPCCWGTEFGGMAGLKFMPGNRGAPPGAALLFWLTGGWGGRGFVRASCEVNGLELTFWPGTGAVLIVVLPLRVAGGDFSCK